MPKVSYREIEAGKGLEIDDGFEGSVKKKLLKRRDGLRLSEEIRSKVEANAMDGIDFMLEKLAEIYPRIDLKYGDHQFKSVDDLFETDVGEKLINKVLLPGIAAPTPISKN